ncbi:MAG: AAA family ATPase, partial [Deltaproteobacteria bacterium]|nr:AAA family ATPase [Deltaproteobacteria bacterium]
MTPTLAQLLAAGEISRLDAHFGECVARLGAGDLDDAGRADLATLAALASRATAAGHVCLPLAEIAGAPVLRAATGDDGPSERGDEAARAALGTLSWPALEAWQAVLLRSAAAGDGSRVTPLVLDASRRLYLHRLWEAERELKAQVSRRVACPPDAVDESWLSGALRRLFPRGADDIDAAVEWRALACLVVMTRRFAVVSGGPGTGKTTGVIRLLALLIEQAFAAGKTLRIALVAPTGKAAARLQETVDAQRGQLPVPESVRAALPRETTTIHRRLGSYVTGFYYGRDNRIPYDIVVVDEASMVDLPLMAHLVGALED